MGKPKSPEHRAKLAEHLNRVKFDRTGLPHTLESRQKMRASRTPASLAERLNAKLDKSAGPDGCWPCTGRHRRDGYADMVVGSRLDGSRRLILAHRIAYEVAHGPIPEGFDVCHRCDNPPCCNEAHLFLGTHSDNMRDREAKGRANRHR